MFTADNKAPALLTHWSDLIESLYTRSAGTERALMDKDTRLQCCALE